MVFEFQKIQGRQHHLWSTVIAIKVIKLVYVCEVVSRYRNAICKIHNFLMYERFISQCTRNIRCFKNEQRRGDRWVWLAWRRMFPESYFLNLLEDAFKQHLFARAVVSGKINRKTGLGNVIFGNLGGVCGHKISGQPSPPRGEGERAAAERDLIGLHILDNNNPYYYFS